MVRGGWGYAYDGLYTCSYKCMRAMRAEDLAGPQKREVKHMEGFEPFEMKPKRGGRRSPVDANIQKTIIEMYENGKSYADIAEKVGMSRKKVYMFCYRRGLNAPEEIRTAAEPEPQEIVRNPEPVVCESSEEVKAPPAPTEHPIDSARVLSVLLDIAELMIRILKASDENGL